MQPFIKSMVEEMAPGGSFDRWHEHCRHVFARRDLRLPRTEFYDAGREKVRIMPPARALRIRDHIEERAKDPANIKSGDRRQDIVVETNPAYVRWFLTDVFTPEIDARLVSVFGSEYFVFWYQFGRAFPTDAPEVSFRWHRDMAPGPFVQITLYLDPTSEHGGRTEAFDLDSTRRFAKVGYVFPPLEERTGDIAPLAAKAGVAAQPFDGPIDAGEALMFRPRDVLHRGVTPARGTRHVCHICVLPCRVPWQQALALWTPQRMAGLMSDWTLDFLPVLANAPIPRAVG